MPGGAQSAAARPVHPNNAIWITILLISSILLRCRCQPDIVPQALLRFKTSLANADPALANWNLSVPPCPSQNVTQGNWAGVICYNGYVWGLQLENMNLEGQIDVDALAPLPFMRALSFMNNNFKGAMPDWRRLGALKSLYLSNNEFSGPIADDAFKGMTSLKKVHMANNRFTGSIPVSLESPKLIELRLENNQFTGSIPPISSEFLKELNVSNNQLQGPIPAPLANLDPSSFAGNKGLCGRPLTPSCDPAIPPPQSEPNLHPGTAPLLPPVNGIRTSPSAVFILCISVAVLILIILLVVLILYRRRGLKSTTPQLGRVVVSSYDNQTTMGVVAILPPETMVTAPKKVEQPGKLSFMQDDRHKFDLQDLMRASAEVLGSGTFGASYKAVLVDGEALVVKRFKQMNSITKEDFHEHMRRLGRLKHPNLLPLVAYLYRKEEKLLVFDYVSNGSLSTHLHGKQAEGLSWRMRLRIIKGVARGLAYLQSELPSLIVPHGHLKSSNVLLDKDFNSLLMDYTLVPIVNPNQRNHILVSYKSPEYANEGQTSNKTDVWCLGILILETLTARPVFKYLNHDAESYGPDLARWVNDIVSGGTQVLDSRMGVQNLETEKLLEIGICCCREDLEERLNLEEALVRIELIQDPSPR